MARRRKYEFRPDKTGPGLLSRLYLTKLQRLALLKWVLYGLLVLFAALLQDVIFSRLRLFGAATDLVPCVILTVCVLECSEGGCLFTLVASCVYQFSGSAPGYHVIVLLTFLGVGATVFRQAFLRKGFSATLVCVVPSLLAYEILVFAVGLYGGRTIWSRIGGFLVTWLLTCLAAPAVYPAAKAISRIGGETWKE